MDGASTRGGWSVQQPNQAWLASCCRRKEYPNFGAGSDLTLEEWWAPIFYKSFLDMDMPKEDIDQVGQAAKTGAAGVGGGCRRTHH